MKKTIAILLTLALTVDAPLRAAGAAAAQAPASGATQEAAMNLATGVFGSEAANWPAYQGADGSIQVRSPDGSEIARINPDGSNDLWHRDWKGRPEHGNLLKGVVLWYDLSSDRGAARPPTLPPGATPLPPIGGSGGGGAAPPPLVPTPPPPSPPTPTPPSAPAASAPTPVSNVPVLPAGATALPPEAIRKADLELEAALKAEADKLEGPRIGLDNAPVSPVVVLGLVLTRDLWVALLRAQVQRLQAIKNLSREEKNKLVNDLRAATPAVYDAFRDMQAAAPVALNPWLKEKAKHDAIIRDADQYERDAAVAKTPEARAKLLVAAADARTRAGDTPWAFYAGRRQQFFNMLEQNENTMLLGLYGGAWHQFDVYLFVRFYTTRYDNDDDRIADLEIHLDDTIERLTDLANEAEAITDFKGILKFGDPEFAPVHQMARQISAATGLTKPAEFVYPLADVAKSFAYSQQVIDTGRDILITLVCLAALGIPIVGAIVNAGVAAIQVVKEGNNLRVQWGVTDDAKKTAAITGQSHVIDQEEKTQAQTGKLVFAVFDLATNLPEVKVALDERALRAGQAAGGTAGTATGTSTGVAATGNTTVAPPGVAATGNTTVAPPGTAPTGNTTVAPPGVVDRSAPTVVDVDRNAPTVVDPSQSVSRTEQTLVDIPLGVRDASALALRERQLTDEFIEVTNQIDDAAIRANPGLAQKRAALQQEIRQINAQSAALTRQRDAASEAATALRLKGADAAALKQAGAEAAALTAQIVALNKRKTQLTSDLRAAQKELLATGEAAAPQLVARRNELRAELQAIGEEQNALREVLSNGAMVDAMAGQDALDFQSAADEFMKLHDERRALEAQMDQLESQLATTTDLTSHAKLERQLEDVSRQRDLLYMQEPRLRSVLEAAQDGTDVADMRELLQRDIANSSLPPERINEIVAKADEATTEEALAEIRDRLRMAEVEGKPGFKVFQLTWPVDPKGDVAQIQQDLSFVHGALLEARATGGLSPTSIAHIDARRAQDPNWFESLTNRFVQHPNGVDIHSAATPELAEELKHLYDNRATLVPRQVTVTPPVGGATSAATSGPQTGGRRPVLSAADYLDMAQKFYEMSIADGNLMLANLQARNEQTAPPATGTASPNLSANPTLANAATEAVLNRAGMKSAAQVSAEEETRRRNLRIDIDRITRDIDQRAKDLALLKEGPSDGTYRRLQTELRQMRDKRRAWIAALESPGTAAATAAPAATTPAATSTTPDTRSASANTFRPTRLSEFVPFETQRPILGPRPAGALPVPALPDNAVAAVNSLNGMIQKNIAREHDLYGQFLERSSTYTEGVRVTAQDELKRVQYQTWDMIDARDELYPQALYEEFLGTRRAARARLTGADSVPPASAAGVNSPGVTNVVPPIATTLVPRGTAETNTATAAGPVPAAPVSTRTRVDLGDPKFAGGPFFGNGSFCCEQEVQPLILHLRIFVTAENRAAPPSLALSLARSAGEFLRRSLAPVPLSAQGPSRAGTGGVTAVLTSVGSSQGEAFTLRLVNDGPAPVDVSADGLVVEPLKRSSMNDALRDLQRRLGDRLKNSPAAKVEGYCLSFELQSPSNGMLFRIASPEIQVKFRPVRNVLNAADRLASAGLLRPDTDPANYLESIKQYAAWTTIENWDVKRFTAAWLDRTRKTAAALKRPWTGTMEQAIVNAAPGRWRDIQLILGEAKTPN